MYHRVMANKKTYSVTGEINFETHDEGGRVVVHRLFWPYPTNLENAYKAFKALAEPLLDTGEPFAEWPAKGDPEC